MHFDKFVFHMFVFNFKHCSSLLLKLSLLLLLIDLNPPNFDYFSNMYGFNPSCIKLRDVITPAEHVVSNIVITA